MMNTHSVWSSDASLSENVARSGTFYGSGLHLTPTGKDKIIAESEMCPLLTRFALRTRPIALLPRL